LGGLDKCADGGSARFCRSYIGAALDLSVGAQLGIDELLRLRVAGASRKFSNENWRERTEGNEPSQYQLDPVMKSATKWSDTGGFYLPNYSCLTAVAALSAESVVRSPPNCLKTCQADSMSVALAEFSSVAVIVPHLSSDHDGAWEIFHHAMHVREPMRSRGLSSCLVTLA